MFLKKVIETRSYKRVLEINFSLTLVNLLKIHHPENTNKVMTAKVRLAIIVRSTKGNCIVHKRSRNKAAEVVETNELLQRSFHFCQF